MKHLLVLILAFPLNLLQSCSESGSAEASSSQSAVEDRPPLVVVNERMDAYNRHDLSTFMGTYADGIAIFTYPDKSLGKGKNHLRSIFESMFEEGSVQVEIQHQIAKDSFVINHETVTDGDSSIEYVSIYEVRDGLIQSVRFVRD